MSAAVRAGARALLGSLVLFGLVLGAPAGVTAQAAPGATLLVIGRVDTGSDASVAEVATQALHAVALARGYTIVALAPSAPRPAIDLASADALSSFATRTGVDRVLHVLVVPDASGYQLHLGVGSRDGSPAVSMARAATLESIASSLTAMAEALLPAPAAPVSGAWTPPLSSTAAPTPSASSAEAPPSARAAPPPPASTAPPVQPATAFTAEPPRERAAAADRPGRDRSPLALMIAGAAVLGAGWILNFIPGIFAGNDGCGFVGCSADAQRWVPFRIVSFVPLAGPWIQLGLLPNADNWWPLWLVFDGLVQLAGAVLLVYGVATDGGDEPSSPSVTLAPSLGPGHAGLTLRASW